LVNPPRRRSRIAQKKRANTIIRLELHIDGGVGSQLLVITIESYCYIFFAPCRHRPFSCMVALYGCVSHGRRDGSWVVGMNTRRADHTDFAAMTDFPYQKGAYATGIRMAYTCVQYRHFRLVAVMTSLALGLSYLIYHQNHSSSSSYASNLHVSTSRAT
jgi:hypothetical protein